jgi:cysteinyl-tRNA synthetase
LVRKRIEKPPEGEPNEFAVSELKRYKEQFESAMNDDLNTSVALSVIFRLVSIANELINYHGEDKVTKGTFSAIDKFFRKMGGGILGIVEDEYEGQAEKADIQRYELAINGLVELRNEARREKNFALSDEIRGILGSVGIVLEDKPDGTTWRLG